MPKILVVDDAMTDRALVGGLLSKSMDCTILEAAEGQAALSRIESDRPDLVLTDLDMPGLDGLGLVDAVKEDYPLIPVILMTAKGSEEIAAVALGRGAASYVPKRRLADDLVDTVQRVLSASRESLVHSQLMHYVTASDTRFELPGDLPLLRSLVAYLLQMLRCLPLGDETERLRVGIALEEALSNAYYHGNLEIAAAEGSGAEEVAARRCTEPPYRDRKVHVRANISRQQALFVIRDDGPGFDPAQFTGSDEAIAEGTAGRGLRLMRAIMDEVTFNEAGNEVTMIKHAIRQEEDDDADEDEDEG